jgi:hypothetical protein
LKGVSQGFGIGFGFYTRSPEGASFTLGIFPIPWCPMKIPKPTPKKATPWSESMTVITIVSTQPFPALKPESEQVPGGRLATSYVTTWSEVEGTL